MNPQMIKLLQILSNSSNPLGMMEQMFGNNPKYQQFKKMVEGKSPEELNDFVSNMFNEQGINLKGLLSSARNFGIKL